MTAFDRQKMQQPFVPKLAEVVQGQVPPVFLPEEMDFQTVDVIAYTTNIKEQNSMRQYQNDCGRVFQRLSQMQGQPLSKLQLLFQLLLHSAETVLVHMSDKVQIGNVIESSKQYLKQCNVDCTGNEIVLMGQIARMVYDYTTKKNRLQTWQEVFDEQQIGCLGAKKKPKQMIV